MERTFEVTEDLMASQGQRFINFAIDYIIRIVLGLLIGALIGVICVFMGNDELLNSIDQMGKVTEYLLGLIILFVYYTLTALIFKRSIAKFLTQTLVVFEDGSTPDNVTFMKRTLCRMIPFDAFSFLGTPSRGWHDTITNTYVVKKEAFEQARELFYSLDEIGADIEKND